MANQGFCCSMFYVPLLLLVLAFEPIYFANIVAVPFVSLDSTQITLKEQSQSLLEDGPWRMGVQPLTTQIWWGQSRRVFAIRLISTRSRPTVYRRLSVLAVPFVTSYCRDYFGCAGLVVDGGWIVIVHVDGLL